MEISSTILTRHCMDVTGDLNASAALPPFKEPTVPVGLEIGWDPEPGLMPYTGEKSWPYRDSNSSSGVHYIVNRYIDSRKGSDKGIVWCPCCKKWNSYEIIWCPCLREWNSYDGYSTLFEYINLVCTCMCHIISGHLNVVCYKSFTLIIPTLQPLRLSS
jgi:hypothetical protein